VKRRKEFFLLYWREKSWANERRNSLMKIKRKVDISCRLVGESPKYYTFSLGKFRPRERKESYSFE